MGDEDHAHRPPDGTGDRLPAHRRGVRQAARPNASALPGHIQILPKGGSGFNSSDATFLGPKFASVSLGDGKPPANIFRPANLAPTEDEAREAFRQKLNDRFAKSRKSARPKRTPSRTTQAERVVKQADVFDVEKEPQKLADRYGRHDFGRHCCSPAGLLEAGVTFVKVSHSNYDTHHENFDFHIEQLGEFDRPFATLLDDLGDRGMLDSTLVVVMSEIGRTPRINDRYGRDHWSKAWCVAMAGCGHQGRRGGRQDERERHRGRPTARCTAATCSTRTCGRSGSTATKNFYPNERPVPIADPKTTAIEEALA